MKLVSVLSRPDQGTRLATCSNDSHLRGSALTMSPPAVFSPKQPAKWQAHRLTGTRTCSCAAGAALGTGRLRLAGTRQENNRNKGKCLTAVRLFNILPLPSAREGKLLEGRSPSGRSVANHDVMRPPLSEGRTALESSRRTIHPFRGGPDRTGLEAIDGLDGGCRKRFRTQGLELFFLRVCNQ